MDSPVGMITSLKYEKRKWKERYKKSKVLTTIVKTVDTFVIIAATCASVTLSFPAMDS